MIMYAIKLDINKIINKQIKFIRIMEKKFVNNGSTVNNKNLVGRTYLRYLENTLRKSVDFSGTPVKLLLRNREKE